jgi:hypothetical protein
LEVAVKIWRLFPFLTAMVLSSSLVGIAGVASFLNSKQILMEYNAGKSSGHLTTRQQYVMLRLTDNWFGSFIWLTGFESLLIGPAHIIILKRLNDHVLKSMPKVLETAKVLQVPSLIPRGREKYLVLGFFAMSAMVLISSSAGLVTAVLAAESFERLGNILGKAADSTDPLGGNTNTSLAFKVLHNTMITETNTLTSYYFFSKTVALTFIVSFYLIIGPLCAIIFRMASKHIETSMLVLRNISSAPASDDESPAFSGALDQVRHILQSPLQQAVKQRRRLMITFIMCLLTLLPRLLHDIMYLIGNLNSARSLECNSCGNCQSLHWLVSEWLWQTPEFLLVSFAISSPLPLAVSLFLLISDREKHMLWSASDEVSSVERKSKEIRDQFRISFTSDL